MALIWIEQKPKKNTEKPIVATAGDKPVFSQRVANKVAQMTGVTLPVLTGVTMSL